MVRAALCRRAICGNVVEKRGDCCLVGHLWPVQTPLDGPFRQAKNCPSHMRRPVHPCLEHVACGLGFNARAEIVSRFLFHMLPLADLAVISARNYAVCWKMRQR